MQNSQDNPKIVRYRLYLVKISKHSTKNKPLFSYPSINNIWGLRKNSFQAFIFESFFSWLEKIFEQRYQSSQLWERFLELSVLIVGEFIFVCHLVAHQFCRGQRGYCEGVRFWEFIIHVITRAISVRRLSSEVCESTWSLILSSAGITAKTHHGHAGPSWS